MPANTEKPTIIIKSTMEMMHKSFSQAEILRAAEANGGWFTVNKTSKRSQKLRTLLLWMSRDENCPLHFHKETEELLIYTIYIVGPF